VLAMAHPLVDQSHRKEHLAAEQRGPELDVGVIARPAPRMVAAIGDAALDRTLKIEPAKFVLARDARYHAKAQLAPGAAAGSHSHPRLQRLFDVGRFVSDRANFLKCRGRSAESVAITDEREQILD